MALDVERVADRVGFINEQVASIKLLAIPEGHGGVLDDPWVLKGVKYTLQTAIEACIDLAFHVSTTSLHYVPRDARDAMRRLAEASIITGEDLDTYSAMIGFRNRVVHGYQEVSPEYIERIIAENLDDLTRFAGLVLRFACS